jgi:preprotein translocase subunit SecG
MKYLIVILAAVAASVIAVLVLKSVGMESAALIGGGVGGAVAGVVASRVFRDS